MKFVWILMLKHGVMSGISLFFFRADLSPQRRGIGWTAHLHQMTLTLPWTRRTNR